MYILIFTLYYNRHENVLMYMYINYIYTYMYMHMLIYMFNYPIHESVPRFSLLTRFH